MKKTALTAIIIAKNEAEMLPNCLACLEWCDAILLIDNGSTDETVKIAEKFGAKVVHFKHTSFDKLRTDALKFVSTPWVMYIDADERISPELAKSISVHLETTTLPTNAMAFKRQNYFYGQEMKWGGWEEDSVTRIFRVQTLDKWQGKVHESPLFSGLVIHLPVPLVHFSHRNTADGLEKSMVWTKVEAQLLFESEVKPVTVLTILRKAIMEFVRRGFLFGGWKDGTPGMIEAIIQGINKALIYIQIWELQRKPSLAETYVELDRSIQDEWKAELARKA